MPKDTRPDWDTYFLFIARAVSMRGECRRRQVGAVIVDDEHHIVGDPGYNGAPSGRPNCFDGACPRGLKSAIEIPPGGDYNDCIAIHAEANALLRAGRAAKGCTLYCTEDPCYACLKLARGAGIVRIVTVHQNADVHLALSCDELDVSG